MKNYEKRYFFISGSFLNNGCGAIKNQSKD